MSSLPVSLGTLDFGPQVTIQEVRPSRRCVVERLELPHEGRKVSLLWQTQMRALKPEWLPRLFSKSCPTTMRNNKWWLWFKPLSFGVIGYIAISNQCNLQIDLFTVKCSGKQNVFPLYQRVLTQANTETLTRGLPALKWKETVISMWETGDKGKSFKEIFRGLSEGQPEMTEYYRLETWALVISKASYYENEKDAEHMNS